MAFQPPQRLALLPSLPGLLAGLQQGHKDVAAFMLQCLPDLPHDSVLHDIGCANSGITLAALNRIPASSRPTLTIHATDASDDLLARAKATIPADAAVLSTAKPTDLPFAASFFTHSLISLALPMQPDPHKVAAEMHRTLKAGGLAVASFWTYAAPGRAANLTHDELRAGSGRRAKAYLSPDKFEPETMLAALAAAGFPREKMRVHKSLTAFEVTGLRAFVEAVWAVIGECEDGWTQADADQWDAAVDRNVEILKRLEGISEVPRGWKIEREVAVVVAVKE